jgi:uncharacterized protein YjbJ (UPF0337 family)
MDENTIVGAGKRFAGAVEGVAGAVTGDAATELAGRARELGGRAQQRTGEAADAIRGAAAEQPLTALLAAGFAGLLLGMFLTRR